MNKYFGPEPLPPGFRLISQFANEIGWLDAFFQLQAGSVEAVIWDKTFGDIDPISRQQWKSIASDVSYKWLETSRYYTETRLILVPILPEIEKASGPQTGERVQAKFSAKALDDWYKTRVALWTIDKRPPSEKDDVAAAKLEIGPGVSRTAIRDRRNRYAPPHWRAHGRRPVINSPK